MTERFGGFVVLDIGEFERDRLLSEDAPYLPPFEITLSATDQPETLAALNGFAAAVEIVEAKFRSPRLEKLRSNDDPQAHLAVLIGFPCVTVAFCTDLPYSRDRRHLS
nr:hypothetical protein [Phyllobacterium zundukense]